MSQKLPFKKIHCIPIDRDDALMMIGQEDIDRAESLIYCKCSPRLKAIPLTDYAIYLDDNNDVVIEGNCRRCGDPVRCFIDTLGDEEVGGWPIISAA